jgi:hypothetical protein
MARLWLDWVSGLGGSGVWSRRVGCLVSEGWVSGLGGLGVWSRRVGCLVSEGWVSGLGGLGVWSRRVGCLVSEGWVSGLGGLGVWSRRGLKRQTTWKTDRFSSMNKRGASVEEFGSLDGLRAADCSSSC